MFFGFGFWRCSLQTPPNNPPRRSHPRSHRPQPSQHTQRVASPHRERTTPALACPEHVATPPEPCPRPDAAAAPKTLKHRVNPGIHALADSGGLLSAPVVTNITCAPATIAKGPPRACGLRSVGLAGLLVDLGLHGPLQTSILPSKKNRGIRGFYCVFPEALRRTARSWSRDAHTRSTATTSSVVS